MLTISTRAVVTANNSYGGPLSRLVPIFFHEDRVLELRRVAASKTRFYMSEPFSVAHLSAQTFTLCGGSSSLHDDLW